MIYMRSAFQVDFSDRAFHSERYGFEKTFEQTIMHLIGTLGDAALLFNMKPYNEDNLARLGRTLHTAQAGVRQAP